VAAQVGDQNGRTGQVRLVAARRSIEADSCSPCA
jgi:hypothetical protein